MAPFMQFASIFLACVAVAGSSRRVDTQSRYSEYGQPRRALASFLFSFNSVPSGLRGRVVTGSRQPDSSQNRDLDDRRHRDRRIPSMVTGDLSDFADIPLLANPEPFDFSIFNDFAYSLGINSIKALALYKAYETFPRGFVTEKLPVAIRPSSVPNAGEGLYARRFMAKGTVLGAYVGKLLSNDAYRKKVQEHPKTAVYCWVLNSGSVLDPTDENGNLLEQVSWVSPIPNLLEEPLFSKPTYLSYINEPPRGADTNVVVEEGGFDGTEVRLIADKNIMEGEELFVDYGQNYDRSHYGNNDELLERYEKL